MKPDKFGKITLMLIVVFVVVMFFAWFVLPSMTPEAMLAEIHQKYRLPKEVEVTDPDDITIETAKTDAYLENAAICAVCGDEIKTYSLGDADAVLHYHEPDPDTVKEYKLSWPELNEPAIIDPNLAFNCTHNHLANKDEFWPIRVQDEESGTLIGGKYKCLDCGRDIVINSAFAMQYPEPNEPEWQPCPDKSTDVMIAEYPEPNESMKYSLSIPTWPDYIELEKELVFDAPSYFLDIGGSEVELPRKEIWPKGTKIYFKDD